MIANHATETACEVKITTRTTATMVTITVPRFARQCCFWPEPRQITKLLFCTRAPPPPSSPRASGTTPVDTGRDGQAAAHLSWNCFTTDNKETEDVSLSFYNGPVGVSQRTPKSQTPARKDDSV